MTGPHDRTDFSAGKSSVVQYLGSKLNDWVRQVITYPAEGVGNIRLFGVRAGCEDVLVARILSDSNHGAAVTFFCIRNIAM